MKKFVAVLGLSGLPIPKKIEFARSVIISMTGNPNFVTPNPTLAVIGTNATALETAYVNAANGAIGLKAVMHAKEQALEISLGLLASYVEGIANANPTLGDAIILSSGMKERKPNPPKANGFRISSTGLPGEVMLRMDADNRAVFTFEVTLTPADEASWTVLHSGTRAAFLATGLISGKRYYFRVAKTDKKGINPWSNVLDIIAL